jgi:hypothetical protein
VFDDTREPAVSIEISDKIDGTRRRQRIGLFGDAVVGSDRMPAAAPAVEIFDRVVLAVSPYSAHQRREQHERQHREQDKADSATLLAS